MMSIVNGKDQPLLFDTEADASGPFAGVVFNRPVDQIFTYRIPPSLVESLRPGARVKVPLGRGNQPVIGYCVSLFEDADADLKRIKDVLEVLDDPPLIDAQMLELTRWMGGYYACAWGQALEAVVPSGVRKGSGTRLWNCLVVPEEVRQAIPTDLTAKQLEVVHFVINASDPLSLPDVCRKAKCGVGVVATLRKRGILRVVKRRMAANAVTEPERPTVTPLPALTDEQSQALKTMQPSLKAGGFATFLLHGVTGSGKTEVYLSAIETVVAQGREAIVLVPEISLTPQTIRRFRRRFPKVAVLHSHLTDAERHRHWQSIAAGQVQVVVGARSAVFAPTRNLGLIVIDEEHETTFKQETAPRYHARDVAVKRAQVEGVPVILGSATPALESWHNSEVGRYTRLTLAKRVGDRPMPEVSLIDLRHEPPKMGSISMALKVAIEQALADTGQVILLLNRRGFHTFVLCPKCGAVVKCNACDVAMTYHKERQRLVCHTCEAERERPVTCSACRAANLFYGGIGTERLEREVRELFPSATVKRMDSDTMRSSGSHELALAAFKKGEVQILLGTQMIAKGLDFPNVTLVGVVNADTALHLPDFRASERTFQLVAQVAGRTGRGDRIGKVLVQTYSPDHPAIVFATKHDYLGFVASELPERSTRNVPPYGRLVRLIARGAEESAVRAYLDAVAQRLHVEGVGVRLLGPSPAPISKIKNLYRHHLQLRASSSKPLQVLLKAVIPAMPPPPGVELAVDVDPVNLL